MMKTILIILLSVGLAIATVRDTVALDMPTATPRNERVVRVIAWSCLVGSWFSMFCLGFAVGAASTGP
jgi:hypothetical protein